METLFVIQLAASIFVGGALVVLQTILAERAPQKIAGIALSIPSTLAVALLFIGLTVSPEAVAAAVPVIPIAFGIVLIFCVIYIYIANSLNLGRLPTMAASTVGGIVVWLVLALPVAYYQLTNLGFSLAAYILLVAISHYFLAVRPRIKTEPIHLKYSFPEKLIRAALGGFIIGFVVIITKLFGPFWGAVFSAFPAVFLATLLIIHWRHGKQFLFHVARALPAASPIFVIYAFAAQYAFPQTGVFVGTLIAYVACSLYPITMNYFIQRR